MVIYYINSVNDILYGRYVKMEKLFSLGTNVPEYGILEVTLEMLKNASVGKTFKVSGIEGITHSRYFTYEEAEVLFKNSRGALVEIRECSNEDNPSWETPQIPVRTKWFDF